MINLGDVNFGLGADTRRLQESLRALQQFGRVVDSVSSSTERSAQRTAAALRRQERAATDALNKVLSLNQTMRKVEGGDQFAARASAAFSTLNRHLSQGTLNTLQYQRAMEQFKASLGNVQRDFRDHSQAQRGAIGTTGKLNELTRALGSSFVFIQGPLGGIATRFATFNALVNTTGASLAAFVAGIAVGGLGIVTFGRQILEAGKQLNAMESQFNAVTGSAIRSNAMIEKVTSIARSAGTALSDTAPAFAKWTAAVSGTALEGVKANEIFETIAKSASVMQLGAEQTTGVFKAFEQMISKGNVQAEELRGQLGDRIPGAFQMASRAMGVTTAKLNEMLKKGQVAAADFLPKLAAEMRKTFGISSDPIDNYTAAVNNLSTSWLQLRMELDRQLGVTRKVQDAYKWLTQQLDWVRDNLKMVQQYATLAIAALTGMVAPAILGGAAALLGWLVKLTFQMGLFNAAINANPLGRLANIAIRLTTILGAVATAAYKYGDQIRVVNGELGTLADYSHIVWNDIMNSQNVVVEELKRQWQLFKNDVANIMDLFSTDFDLTWDNLKLIATDVINGIVGVFSKGMQELTVISTAMRDNILADFQGIANGMNNVRKWFSPLIDPITEAGKQPNQGFKWLEDSGFLDKTFVRKSWAEIQAEIDRIWKQPPTTGVGERAVSDFEAYIEGLRNQANTRRLAILYGQYQSQAWRRQQGPQLPIVPPRTPPNLGGGGAELTDKEVRALERKKRALDDINHAISQAQDEVIALSDTGSLLDSLTDQFKREDEVRKYAKAMQRAGVDTQTMTEKTQQLYELLAMRDYYQKAREALVSFRDSFAGAFDQIGSSIVDMAFDGKNALESLKNLALSVVKDILKSYMQLAVINPFKNALLGTNEPTLQGGFLKNLKNIFNIGSNSGYNQLGTGRTPNLGLSGLINPTDPTLGLFQEQLKLSAEGLGGLSNSVFRAMGSFGTFGEGLGQLGTSLYTSAQQLLSAQQSSGGGWLANLAKLFGGLGGGISHMWGLSPRTTIHLLGGGIGMYAKGGVFAGGRPMKMFAKGGIQNMATNFAMANGTMGRMAEAGTEAIMPLGRDSSGNLGVRSVGEGDNGKTTIEISLSPEVIAQILSQAQDQSINITKKGVESFSKSKEFKARASEAVKIASINRQIR